MHKLQHKLNQKIQGLISSLPSKDAALLQSRLNDLSLVGQAPRQQAIAKLRESIAETITLQDLMNRKQLNERLKSNKSILEIIKKGKQLVQQIDRFLQYDYRELDISHGMLINILQQLDSFQSLSLLSFPEFGRLRQQLYMQILVKIAKFQQQFDHNHDNFKKQLGKLGLPLKRNQVRKQQPQAQTRYNILRAMHRQSSTLTIKRQINGLLQREENFNGKLFDIYWQESVKAALYHFTTDNQLHNLAQPVWMFEYLQHILHSNYKYFHQYMLKGIRQQISHSISTHYFSASIQFLFLNVIQQRLKQDIKLLNPFLSFTFLDELSSMEDKLSTLFGIRPDMLQRVVLKHEIILDKALQYQNQRFQTKIFQDYIGINYSQINLKNLDAYNYMVTFLNLLDRLYRKYRPFKDKTLRAKIARFYRQKILVLVAHLKTSFDRIYHHSRLPRLDILISFKRTESQLRSNLSDITQFDPELDESLQKQYYCYLQQFYEACALQALTPVHKKLHISLGDIINKLSSVDDLNHQQLLKGFIIIHQEWAAKMDLICKFSNYVDNKLRTIFFTYLEATGFSLVGLSLFLKIFQPYLQVIFNEERHRLLISLISTQRQRYMEQIQAHPNIISFLTPEEANKLNKFKEANPNL